MAIFSKPAAVEIVDLHRDVELLGEAMVREVGVGAANVAVAGRSSVAATPGVHLAQPRDGCAHCGVVNQ